MLGWGTAAAWAYLVRGDWVLRGFGPHASRLDPRSRAGTPDDTINAARRGTYLMQPDFRG